MDIGRIGFYEGLTDYRTPALGPYFSRCYISSRNRVGDNTWMIAQAIRVRCLRAIQARDEIGLQFYQPQHNGTRDEMMYHFDYMTGLLYGALDGEARIARRSYAVQLPERNLNFWTPRFAERLAAAGANTLVELIESAKVKAYKDILRSLRNTMHDAGLLAIGGYTDPPRPGSLVELPRADLESMAEHAASLGGHERWGIDSRGFEPYSVATGLVGFGLRFVDAIAAATDLSGLPPPAPDPPNVRRVVSRRRKDTAYEYFESDEYLQLLSLLGDGTVAAKPQAFDV